MDFALWRGDRPCLSYRSVTSSWSSYAMSSRSIYKKLARRWISIWIDSHQTVQEDWCQRKQSKRDRFWSFQCQRMQRKWGAIIKKIVKKLQRMATLKASPKELPIAKAAIAGPVLPLTLKIQSSRWQCQARRLWPRRLQTRRRYLLKMSGGSGEPSPENTCSKRSWTQTWDWIKAQRPFLHVGKNKNFL